MFQRDENRFNTLVLKAKQVVIKFVENQFLFSHFHDFSDLTI